MIGFGLSLAQPRGRGIGEWTLEGSALDLDFQRGRYVSAGSVRAFADLFTFTRSSSGTAQRLDGSLQTFAAGEPRITDRGLLIEEARTNTISRSVNFSDAYWFKTSCTTVQTGPTDRFGNSPFALRSSGVSAAPCGINANNLPWTLGAPSTVSVIAKAGTKNWFRISIFGAFGSERRAWFDLANCAVGSLDPVGTSSRITNLGDGWCRCEFTVTPDQNSIVGQVFLRGADANGNISTTAASGEDILYVSHAQQELGSFATSPIVTTGVAATRNADVPVISGSAFSAFFNQTEGVLFVDAVSDALLVAATRRFVEFNDGTGGNRLILGFSASNISRFLTQTAGVTQSDNTVTTTIAAGVLLAAVYKLNDFLQATNGSITPADTSATVPVVSQITFGAQHGDFGGSNTVLNGYIRRFVYFPTRLGNATVEALTEPPTSFSFTDITGATVSTLRESNVITVAGLFAGVEVPAMVTGGEMSIDGGPYRTAAALVRNGSTIRLRTTAAGAPATAVNVVLVVGNTSDTWTVTTA